MQVKHAGQDGGHVCGECVHWQRKPKPTLGAVEITDQTPGECLESIHSSAVMRPNGRGSLDLVAVMSYYPQPPDDFPACSKFQPKIDLIGQR